MITHEKAKKYLDNKERYLKFLDRTPIEFEIDKLIQGYVIFGTSKFGNTIELIGNHNTNFSEIQLSMKTPEIKETKVIGAAFLIQRNEGNIGFNQLNFIVQNK